MPHRPERIGAAVPSSATMFATRVNGLSEEAASHIMRPSSVGMYSHHHPAGVVTPLMTAKPWQTAQHPGARGMFPVLLDNNKSSDSTDRSTGTNNKHDEDCTVATLTTEASSDELEKREVTANALLLVSTAAVRHNSAIGNSYETNLSTNTKDEKTNEAVSNAAVPLKKRKKHLDFLRRNSDEGMTADGNVQPCHVSPVSHSSVEGRTVSHEETTPQRPGRLGADAARSHSYDSKDSPYQKDSTQELLDSSKIYNANDIPLPSQVVISHFPSVLHRVLSDPEFAGSVISWLPDGESWKVHRWDALRRQVLPRYFSNLRDENGAGCGTIDAFLWHLTAWGFEEVKDGSDVGAYRHHLFIRGAQKLSNKMRFTATPSSSQGPKTVSPARPRHGEDRMMLQVPTLAGVGRVNVGVDPNAPNKRARYDEQSSAVPHGAIRRPSPGPQHWMGYRSEDPYADAQAWGHYYSDPSRIYPGAMYSDPRYNAQTIHHRPMPADHMMGAQAPIYSPPQVRSGRGAIRVAGTRSPPSSSPVTTPPPSNISSFPVSNRGKGRKTPVCRAPIRSADNVTTRPSSTETSPVALEEAERIGNSVKDVAMAVSRKTKRKLPLARKVEKDTQ